MSRQDIGREPIYGGSATAEAKRRLFLDGQLPVAVYGLGKMGLPLAAVFAETTGNVVGVDVDQTVVDHINNGESPVQNEPGLPYLVSETVRQGSLRATADSTAAAEAARVHVVIVPTTLGEDDVDLSVLESVAQDVGSGLSRGDMVIVESTVPPGTSRSVVLPILEEASGLEVGEFGLAFCPERTASGQAIRDIRSSYPKVVGGIDEESTAVAELIYGEITENRVIPVSDITTAECVKVFEGVYRDVNIALANELARFVDEIGVDVREAIAVANTQPFCDIHDPGAGVGGHCIPYYPYFLINGFETGAPLLEAARSVNDSMPGFTAAKLIEGLEASGIDPEDATVAVLGVAFRPGVTETRASPAFPIIERLTEAGINVFALDPIVEDLDALGLQSAAIEDLPALDLDGAVLVTAHDAFDRIDWAALDDLVIVDARDALALEGAGHSVYTVGRG